MIRRVGSISAVRLGGAVLSTFLALFILATFSAGAAFGQGGGPPDKIQEEGEGTWHSGVLRIKVTSSAADAAQPATENGVAVLGIASVDELNADYGAVSVEPVFDVGGEYEERQRDHGLHRWYEIRFEEGAVATDASVEAASAEYSALAEVQVAEGDARAEYHVTENSRPSVMSLLDPLPGTPDDPLYDDQYGFQNIEAEGGWQTRTGDTTVVVSVHDSGITGNFDGGETTIDHPDLEPNVWYGGDTSDGSVHGKSFSGDPANLVDNNGHGTHVTVVVNEICRIAGEALPVNAPVARVSPVPDIGLQIRMVNCRLLPIEVSGDS